MSSPDLPGGSRRGRLLEQRSLVGLKQTQERLHLPGVFGRLPVGAVVEQHIGLTAVFRQLENSIDPSPEFLFVIEVVIPLGRIVVFPPLAAVSPWNRTYDTSGDVEIAIGGNNPLSLGSSTQQKPMPWSLRVPNTVSLTHSAFLNSTTNWNSLNSFASETTYSRFLSVLLNPHGNCASRQVSFPAWTSGAIPCLKPAIVSLNGSSETSSSLAPRAACLAPGVAMAAPLLSPSGRNDPMTGFECVNERLSFTTNSKLPGVFLSIPRMVVTDGIR